jgi:predicted transposase/invertase (TIGR01784 family)
MNTLYTPLDNFFFFKVMGEKGDEVQLLGFINAVLHRTGENRFSSVEILENKSFSAKVKGDKTSTLDVRAVLQDGTRTNTEVQVRNKHNMGKRSLFYWSREYASSLEAGQDYRELPNGIAINLLDYDFPPLREVHTCFHLREDVHRDYVLTDALEIHFLNMVQYRKQWKGKLNDPLSRWLAWFNMGKGKRLAEEAVKMDAAIQAANERMVYLSGDKEAIRAYERHLMALSDYTSEMNYARDVGTARGMRRGMKKGMKQGMQQGMQQGMEQGMEKGMQQGMEKGMQQGMQQGMEKGRAEGEAIGRNDEKLEIARKMKKAGRPLSEIMEFTGLPAETLNF